MELIYEKSQPGRRAGRVPSYDLPVPEVPAELRREAPPRLPEVPENEIVRHFTALADRNFGIDTGFYPLGSCTMKYNPRVNERVVGLPGFRDLHPLQEDEGAQGALELMWELQQILAEVAGLPAVTLQPAAGSQGELTGLMLMRAAFADRGEPGRNVIITADTAHGTNPASVTMAGFELEKVATTDRGNLDLEDLRAKVDDRTAGLMLTNPSTLGVFERRIEEVARIVHQAGGLLYYDGANLNAILGKVRPGDMGFDVIHMNLHKTFSTPHGGGGPGAGAVGVSTRLMPFLPIPVVGREGERYRWLTEKDLPQSIGRLSAFMGNAGVLLRAYIYMRMLGREGMSQVGEYATLNANYLMARLAQSGFDPAYPSRRASHEFIITVKRQARELEVTAMDFAKRLLDYGFHAPTTYFPLLVPECLLIEPTETESKDALDGFIAAMAQILTEASQDPERVTGAPHTMPVRRLDDVRAAKQLDLTWQPIAPN